MSGPPASTPQKATTEIDIYGGIKGKAGPISWDLGLIYYYYPGEPTGVFGFGNYLELKAAGSIDVTKGGTLTGTVFYSPDYNGFLGSTVTLEGTFTQTLPKVGMFSPTFGATVGRLYADDSDLEYTYWNVGLTLGFLEKWSVDIRYWGTDGEGLADTFLADDRIVAHREVHLLISDLSFPTVPGPARGPFPFVRQLRHGRASLWVYRTVNRVACGTWTRPTR